jgi:hypothetical protein
MFHLCLILIIRHKARRETTAGLDHLHLLLLTLLNVLSSKYSAQKTYEKIAQPEIYYV